MARSSKTLAVAVLAVVAVLGARQAFVPAPQQQAIQVNVAAIAAAAAAAAPMAAVADPDEYMDYPAAGEYTQYMTVGYFGLTTAYTLFAFFSYLILTKLKII